MCGYKDSLQIKLNRLQRSSDSTISYLGTRRPAGDSGGGATYEPPLVMSQKEDSRTGIFIDEHKCSRISMDVFARFFFESQNTIICTGLLTVSPQEHFIGSGNTCDIAASELTAIRAEAGAQGAGDKRVMRESARRCSTYP